MNCAEFRELASAFALGALEPGERAAAEAHLSSSAAHQGCFEALSRANLAAEALASSLVPAQPADAVWAAIESELGFGRRSALPLRELGGWMAAAAAVAALLFVQNGRARDRRAAEASRQAIEQRVRESEQAKATCTEALNALRGEADGQREALALLQSPTAKAFPLSPQGAVGFRASAVIDPAQHRGLVVASALTAQPGRDYELWIIRGTDKIPAGILRTGPSGAVVAPLDDRLLSETPDALAITIEPTGGRPQPTGPIVLVGAYPKA